uniref:Uncharacterized protein n=1 Tax=uncultured bacterium contig00061 TaxID=1181544 RepID=A0A806JYW9_9BACT|nr:hypothetical protein [uncultured bacterium contig00061]
MGRKKTAVAECLSLTCNDKSEFAEYFYSRNLLKKTPRRDAEAQRVRGDL